MKQPIDILLVDDSPTHLAIVADLLLESGYRVATAGDGIDAINKIKNNPPALILSDVMMPRLNGYHLCRLLKNDPATMTLPVILLTNLNERNDGFWGEHAGADLFLEKNIAPEKLLAQIKPFLEKPRHISPPAPGKYEDDVHDRINHILDQLLYDSTVSNKILELTSLAHNHRQLATEFVQFLSKLCRFDTILLVLPTHCDDFTLYIQTAEKSDPHEYYCQLKTKIPDLPLYREIRHTVRLGRIDTPGNTGSLHLAHHAPFQIDGKFSGAFAFFRDDKLSDRVAHALKVVAERLQVVIRDIITLNDIERFKGDFVSMLVHDLRSPLTSIKGFNDILTSKILGPINSEQQSALDSVQENCDRMLVLIEDLLEISKLEQRKLDIHPGPVNLEHLAETAKNILQAQFDAAKLEVTFDFKSREKYVIADGKQIGRVFSNLLSNATKFTPQKGRIKLEIVDESTVNGDYLRVRITDNGPGIPAHQQHQLFNRYMQLNSSGPINKGTGLGLAISKEIVQLHDGEISVTSPVDSQGGSCFSFTLPTFER